MKTLSHVRITPASTSIDDRIVSTSPLSGLYREFAGDYPKFFKMDGLCKLGFLSAELLLKDMSPEEKENMAVVLFNRNGSLITDRNYGKTISDTDYFPSPALFVYTLANIVTGEIAIRHKIFGETSFYVLDSHDTAIMNEIVNDTFLTSSPSYILTGWVDFENDDNYLADIRLITN